MQITCFSRAVVVFWTGEHHMCGNLLHSLEWGYILVFPDISANSFGRRDWADAGNQTATQKYILKRCTEGHRQRGNLSHEMRVDLYDNLEANLRGPYLGCIDGDRNEK